MKALILKETYRGLQPVEIPDEMFSRRILFFTSEVSAKTAELLICQLLWLDSADPGKPIKLCINSPGGDVYSGLAIVDIIRSLRSPVDVYCQGICASMGAIIFLQGRERYIDPHSRLMIHDPSFGGGSIAGVKPLSLQDDVEKLMNMRKELAEIIAERTGQALDDVLEKTKTDYTMNAQEALEGGFATKIGSLSFIEDKEKNDNE